MGRPRRPLNRPRPRRVPDRPFFAAPEHVQVGVNAVRLSPTGHRSTPSRPRDRPHLRRPRNYRHLIVYCNYLRPPCIAVAARPSDLAAGQLELPSAPEGSRPLEAMACEVAAPRGGPGIEALQLGHRGSIVEQQVPPGADPQPHRLPPFRLQAQAGRQVHTAILARRDGLLQPHLAQEGECMQPSHQLAGPGNDPETATQRIPPGPVARPTRLVQEDIRRAVEREVVPLALGRQEDEGTAPDEPSGVTTSVSRRARAGSARSCAPGPRAASRADATPAPRSRR